MSTLSNVHSFKNTNVTNVIKNLDLDHKSYMNLHTQTLLQPHPNNTTNPIPIPTPPQHFTNLTPIQPQISGTRSFLGPEGYNIIASQIWSLFQI